MQAKTASARELVSKEEWQARVDLAAAYRLVALFGWDDLIFTHISARVAGPEHHFLINPYGMMFDEITASSLVKIDLNGNKVMDSPYDINPAGFTIHSAVHAAPEDALCVMHLHTTHGVAVAAQKQGLLPISQQSMLALASIAYHDYEGLALNESEKPRLVADLGDKNNLMLRNHGLLTIGTNAAKAFLSKKPAGFRSCRSTGYASLPSSPNCERQAASAANRSSNWERVPGQSSTPAPTTPCGQSLRYPLENSFSNNEIKLN